VNHSVARMLARAHRPAVGGPLATAAPPGLPVLGGAPAEAGPEVTDVGIVTTPAAPTPPLAAKATSEFRPSPPDRAVVPPEPPRQAAAGQAPEPTGLSSQKRATSAPAPPAPARQADPPRHVAPPANHDPSALRARDEEMPSATSPATPLPSAAAQPPASVTDSDPHPRPEPRPAPEQDYAPEPRAGRAASAPDRPQAEPLPTVVIDTIRVEVAAPPGPAPDPFAGLRHHRSGITRWGRG
jgi:hypothetical protein